MMLKCEHDALTNEQDDAERQKDVVRSDGYAIGCGVLFVDG
jgi:hypothetical protein